MSELDLQRLILRLINHSCYETINANFKQMVADIPLDVKTEVELSFAIADKINALMIERGLSRKQFADALGKKPSEITKWLSGQHNFTIRTLAMLSSFFGESLIVTQ